MEIFHLEFSCSIILNVEEFSPFLSSQLAQFSLPRFDSLTAFLFHFTVQCLMETIQKIRAPN